ncbi:hypothetical protein M0657_005780 [Pyricularia oryzae]|uniref:Phospholipase/carboxylesterase/thioesterase domain-containing protein n=3 Tax=Pyricularia oryzae TaxID=318829 RepID=Q2KFL8_PYRO7|nr:hypothetical protein MGCH7_ch7g667 [Pyricularia oryzae 70-15]ELQ40208.1 carboxylesterase [Pyricularia oryzae Y34]KAI7921418.1 hypothetical protein M9X92_005389 [Pyricularia oryzae]KAI7922160.1 hypothetical protein M0657_005780 [Pyricularia oryzae]
MNDTHFTVQASAPHTHTVVFLHGRGGSARTLAQSLLYSKHSDGRTLFAIFPSFRWVFPEANKNECAAFPGQSMQQWFDIWNVQDFSNREELQAVGLRKSVGLIRGVIADEARALGGRYDRVFLAGISQGAATSVHTLLNLNIPPPAEGGASRGLAAFLGFSCRMPFPGRTLSDTRKILGLDDVPSDDVTIKNTPILLEHCIDDPLVLVGNGRVLRDTLRGFGATVHWLEYPDGGHWFNSPAGITDAAAFLTHIIKSQGFEVGTQAQPQAQAPTDEMDLS